MTPSEKPEAGWPVILFQDRAAWEVWLAENVNSSGGVWLQFAKKSAAIQSVSYHEAVEAALCYGWIDGQAKRGDAATWLQKFTPRGPRSIWSKINRAKALELIEQGRMQPAGYAAIQRAKENGAWESAYDSHKTSSPPPDFQAALDQRPQARAFFETLNSQNRYAILFRIQTAKKVETRQKRIQQFIQMLEKGEKIYP